MLLNPIQTTNFYNLPAMNMYTMSHQSQAYAPYPTAPMPPAPRQYSGHGTSSAFSSSANPDEDWTKISDLAERRRIQNRIAQRNYRKKLKRRLEDLERRAGEEGTPAPSEKQTATKTKRSSPASSKSKTPAQPKVPSQGQFTPPLSHDDEFYLPAASEDIRERSHTPPMFQQYTTYPPPDELIVGSSYHAQQYAAPMTTAETYGAYMAPHHVLPPMNHFNDAVKRESYPSDDGMGYVQYGYVPGMEMSQANPYDTDPNTPPLSHSFDHSANVSEAGYEYPKTPLSMPASPDMIQSQSRRC